MSTLIRHVKYFCSSFTLILFPVTEVTRYSDHYIREEFIGKISYSGTWTEKYLIDQDLSFEILSCVRTENKVIMGGRLSFDRENRRRRIFESRGRRIWPPISVREEIQQTQSSIEISSWHNTTERPDDSKIDDNHSFDQAIRPIIAAVQIFGILPIDKNFDRAPDALPSGINLKQLLYTVTIIILLIIRTAMAAYRTIDKLKSSKFNSHGGVLNMFEEIIFCVNGTVSMVIFLWISLKWMNLMKEWTAVEDQLKSSAEDQPQYRCKFYITSCLVMIPAIVEHSLAIFENFTSPRLIANVSNGFFDEYVQAYTFRIIPSSLDVWLVGIMMFIVQEINTFTWNFTDLFIMLVSTGLSEKYTFLNRAASISIKKNGFSIDWLELRQKYTALNILVNKTDECISPLVLLSFAMNTYLICLQLFNGFVFSRTGPLSAIYFFGSFIFLVSRTIAVTLFAAGINDRSKSFLPIIYRCPPSCFTNETKRLQYQLTTSNVALTGMKYFSITRQFLMTIASLIITYEVFLLSIN